MRSYFHLHLVSDSTGETLITVARAAAAQYEGVSAIEHVYPLVRSATQLERVISEIETAPGIVLYTLVETDLSSRLEDACRDVRLAAPVGARPRARSLFSRISAPHGPRGPARSTC